MKAVRIQLISASSALRGRDVPSPSCVINNAVAGPSSARGSLSPSAESDILHCKYGQPQARRYPETDLIKGDVTRRASRQPRHCQEASSAGGRGERTARGSVSPRSVLSASHMPRMPTPSLCEMWKQGPD